jgi:HD-GYP domain-containing protein (c-di-GMP phosphodiesterase class II)
MLRVPISHTKPGMVLAMAVYNPRASSRLLLRPGAILEQSTIERLSELHLPEVWIKYPNMEMISKFVSSKIMSSRAEIATDVATAFDAAGKNMHARLDYTRYQQAMGMLMTRLIDDPDAAIFIGEIADTGSPAIRHGANVGYISMLMGIRLGFYLLKERSRLSPRLAKDVTSLGVAAMLHDIGMTRLKASTLERWSRDHDHTDPEWQDHVKIGYNMIKGQVEPSAAAAVLHHHQRYDGSGFPQRKGLDGKLTGISGSKIHIFARILLVADLYDRLVHPAYSLGDSSDLLKSRTPVYAIHTLMQPEYQDWIDPIVFKALVSVCPAYPPGTQVRLSDGLQCVVVDWDPRNPCRPVVAEISPFEDEMLEELELIDLRENEHLSIIESEGQDVSAYNFYPDHEYAFDLRMVEKSMFNGFYSLENEQAKSDSQKNGDSDSGQAA